MKEMRPFPGSDIRSLTGIRLFAALGVLFFHFSEINADQNLYFHWGMLDPLVLDGAVGVDIFFVLSGFILTHAYRERFKDGKLNRGSWFGFIQNRFARVWPLHIVTMVCMLGVFLIGRHMGVLPHNMSAFTVRSIIANITMTHAWFPGVATINGPAWSISAEWFAYLFFPFLCAWLLRRSVWWPLALAIATLVTAGLIPQPHALALISLELPFGVAIYELTVRSRFTLGSWMQWAALGFAILSMYCFAPFGGFFGQVHTGSYLRAGIMIAAACGFASLSRSDGFLSRFLSLPLIVYGGEISYSIYMCHWAVWTVIHRGLEHLHALRNVGHFWFMLLAFVFTIPVSIAAYHFVELPARAALRRVSKRRPLRENGEGLAKAS